MPIIYVYTSPYSIRSGYYTLTAIFHLLTYILAVNVKIVPMKILPALNPTAPVNEPPCAFSNAPAIGVPIKALQMSTLNNHRHYAILEIALVMPNMVPISRRSLQILAVEAA